MTFTPWLAHLYTASGAFTALAAALAVHDGNYRVALGWLAAATVIDATDGVLARALRVKERLPWFDGAKLDDLVDYLTYVFVPVFLIVRAALVPPALALWLGSAVLMASAYGFSRVDAKVATTDYFFTGFPSYWNIAALYLYVWRFTPVVNAAILAFLVVMVFVPTRYVYPSRTATWRVATNLLGVMWAVCLVAMIWRLPAVDGPWMLLSLVFPVYYLTLSARLSAAERGPERAGASAP
ncbi:MAG: CDP-diacylglycerol O-phosphatidyltransferase [Acidobacteriota bacterium]